MLFNKNYHKHVVFLFYIYFFIITYHRIERTSINSVRYKSIECRKKVHLSQLPSSDHSWLYSAGVLLVSDNIRGKSGHIKWNDAGIDRWSNDDWSWFFDRQHKMHHVFFFIIIEGAKVKGKWFVLDVRGTPRKLFSSC